MSVIGRLWRRAPAWRMLLVLAICSTGLVAMFPPALPSLDALRASLGRGGASHATGPQAHYAPIADPPPLDYSTIDFPPLAETRTFITPFAGRQVPLPAGKWSELALLRNGGPLAEQVVVLGRIQSNRLTGMIVVGGTPAVQPAAAAAMPQPGCRDIMGLGQHDLSPANTANNALQECWVTRRLATAALIDPAGQDPLESKAFARLGSQGIEVPAHLLTSRYFRHDQRGALLVTILLPDPATNDAVLMRRADAWMQRWVPLLHHGFDGTLKQADITAALARDPGAGSSPS